MKEKETGVKATKIIALDFDGTCVKNEKFPSVGADIGAVPILKKLIENGHKLILWTVRTDIGLKNAVKWFDDNQIELSGINKYKSNSNSPKINADLFIDDKSINAPLIHPNEGKPYINWKVVESLLKKMDLI